MITCYIIVNGRTNREPLSLPKIPNRGDIVSSSPDPKTACYFVNRVEYITGRDAVNLHVQEFPNQISAVNAINGFRNSR